MKIIIVDDDNLVCDSLKIILGAQPGIEVVSLGSSGDDAVRLSRELAPDVALLDIQMPGRDGLSAAREILAENPAARVVFLTTFSDDEYIVAALKLGARIPHQDGRADHPTGTRPGHEGQARTRGKARRQRGFLHWRRGGGVARTDRDFDSPAHRRGRFRKPKRGIFSPDFSPAFPQQENRPEAYGLRPASFLVAGKGIEPLTRGFSVPCSTN